MQVHVTEMRLPVVCPVKRDADTAPDEYEEREEREDAAEHV